MPIFKRRWHAGCEPRTDHNLNFGRDLSEEFPEVILPEPQPAEAKLERRPFQFSLRSLFGPTCGTAAFFSLARALGYADAVVILAAIVVAVGVMEYPRRVHLAPAILLTLVAGTLFVGQLTADPVAGRTWLFAAPDRLDFVTKGMFFRGWPLSPCMICLYHGMRFHPEEGAVPIGLGVRRRRFCPCPVCREGRLRVLHSPASQGGYRDAAGYGTAERPAARFCCSPPSRRIIAMPRRWLPG